MRLSQRFVGAYAPRSRSHRQQSAYADVVLQNDEDAKSKGEPGPKGRRHCARHVRSYPTAKFISAVVVTRVLGYRVPLYALFFGTALNGGAHYVIDRRQPLWNFLRSRWARRLCVVGKGKATYVEFAVVQRGNGVADKAGSGTAIDGHRSGYAPCDRHVRVTDDGMADFVVDSPMNRMIRPPRADRGRDHEPMPEYHVTYRDGRGRRTQVRVLSDGSVEFEHGLTACAG